MEMKENDATGRKRRKIIYFYEKKYLKMKSVQIFTLISPDPSAPAGPEPVKIAPAGPGRYPWPWPSIPMGPATQAGDLGWG